MNSEINFPDKEIELPGEGKSFPQEDLELLYTAEDYQEYCFHPEPLVREWAIKQLVHIYPEEEATLMYIFQLFKLIADFEKKYIDDEELGAIPLTLDDDPRGYVIVSGERESSEIAKAIAATAEDFRVSAEKFARENSAEDWLDTWLAGYQDHKKSLKYTLIGYFQDNFRQLDPVKVNIYSGGYSFSADGYLDPQIISYVYYFYGKRRAGGRKIVRDIWNFLHEFEEELDLNSLGYSILSLKNLQTEEAYQILKNINPKLQVQGAHNNLFFYFSALFSYRKPEDVLQLIENACENLNQNGIERIFLQLSELFWGREYLDYIKNFKDIGLEEAFTKMEGYWPGNPALSRAKVKVRQCLSRFSKQKTAGIEEIFMKLAGLLRDELAGKYPQLELPELPGGVKELQPELIMEQAQEIQELSEEDFWLGLILSQLLQQRSNIFRSNMSGFILNFLLTMLIVLLEDNDFGKKLGKLLPEDPDRQQDSSRGLQSWKNQESRQNQENQGNRANEPIKDDQENQEGGLKRDNQEIREGELNRDAREHREKWEKHESEQHSEHRDYRKHQEYREASRVLHQRLFGEGYLNPESIAENKRGETPLELQDSQLELLWELFSLPRKNLPEEVLELMYCFGEHFSQELHQIVKDSVISDRARKGEGELEADSSEIEEFQRYYLLHRSLKVLGKIGYQPAGPDIIKLLQNYQGEYITPAAEQALAAMDFFAPELMRKAVASGERMTALSFLDTLRKNPCLAGVKLVITWYQKGQFAMPEPIILFLRDLGSRLGQRFIEKEFPNLELGYVYDSRIVLAYLTGVNINNVDFYHNKIAEFKEDRQNSIFGSQLGAMAEEELEKALDSLKDEQREIGAKRGGFSSESEEDESIDSIADQGKPGSEYKRTEEGALVRKREKVGRNDPCPCGSGKKYKKCCL